MKPMSFISLCFVLFVSSSSIQAQSDESNNQDLLSREHRQFPQRLVILPDTTKTVLDLSDYYENAPRYWRRIFGSNGKMAQWLVSLEGQGLSFDWETDSVQLLLYGFRATGGSWEKDYIHGLDAGPKLQQALTELNNRYQSLLRGESWKPKWDITTAVKPMALAHLRDERTHDALVGRLFLLNITDNESNLRKNRLGLTELQYMKQNSGTAEVPITGYDHLEQIIFATDAYYFLDPEPGIAIFPHRGKTFETDPKYLFTNNSRNRGAISAELVEVKPAIPLVPGRHFVLNESLDFRIDAEGYSESSIFSSRDRGEDPYRLMNLRLKITGGEGEILYDEVQAFNGRELAFPIALDKDALAGEKPKTAEITALFRYRPPGFDLGLVIEDRQTVPLSFQSVGMIQTRPWGREIPLNHDLMGQFPDLSQEDLVARYLVIRQWWTIGLILAGMMLVGLVAWLIYLFMKRYPKPKLAHFVQIGNSNGANGDHSDPVLECQQVSVESFQQAPNVVIGRYNIANDAGPNRLSHPEQLAIEKLRIFSSACRPKSVTPEPGLLQLGTATEYETIDLIRNREWPIILNLRHLAGVAGSWFENQALTIQGTIEYAVRHPRLNGQAAGVANFQVPIPIEPAPYRFEPELRRSSLFEGGVEYDDYPAALVAGTFWLRDRTGFRFRTAASLRITGFLNRISGDTRHPCPAEVLYLERQKETSIDRKQASMGIVIHDELIADDLEITIFLDLAALPVISVETLFELTFLVEKLESGEETCRQALTFTIRENQTDSMLRLDRKIQGKWAQLRESSFDLRGEPPFIHGSAVARDALHLRLVNTASFPDDDPPNNIIAIDEFSLNCASNEAETEHSLLSLRLQQGERFLDPSQEMITLLPGGDDLDLRVQVMMNADAVLFERPEQKWTLVIRYQRWDRRQKVLEENSLELSFFFRVLPNLGSEVVAIDYGTSAIAVAHNYTHEEESHRELLPLRKLWEDANPRKGQEAHEKDPHLLVSTISIEGEDRMKLGHHDYRGGKSDNCLIPFLKSYIGACRKQYSLGDRVFETKDLIRFAYDRLHRDFILRHRKSKGNEERYKRMVITHPNSYLDGQVYFLAERIRQVIPEIREIQAMSESDAVIYAYLKRQAARGELPELAEPGYENILCFDMGAGTVDLSLRAVFYDLDEEGNPYPVLDGIHPCPLLGMASVNGAGNLLDEILAQLIEREMVSIKACFERLKEDGEVNPGGFEVFSCFSQEQDGTRRASQEAALESLHAAIREAKGQWTGEKAFSIKLPSSQDQRAFPFFYMEENTYVRLAQEWNGPLNLRWANETEVYLDLPASTVFDRLASDFFPSQVYEPLEVVLRDGNGGGTPVHTILISGRGALFPWIREAVVERVTQNNGDEKPRLIEHRQNMKDVVVEGALSWGIDAMDSRQLFSTPLLHGKIGVAFFIAGKWRWEPLLEGDDWSPEGRGRRMGTSSFINPHTCQFLLVLHTACRSPELVHDYLEQIKVESGQQLRADLDRTGFFRVFFYYDKLTTLHAFKRVRFQLYPAHISDGSDLYGDINLDEDFPNIRVEVAALDPDDQRIILQKRAAAVGKPLTQHKTWPSRVFHDPL